MQKPGTDIHTTIQSGIKILSIAAVVFAVIWKYYNEFFKDAAPADAYDTYSPDVEAPIGEEDKNG